MQVNYFAPFYLTVGLIGHMKPDSRILNVAGGSYKWGTCLCINLFFLNNNATIYRAQELHSPVRRVRLINFLKRLSQSIRVHVARCEDDAVLWTIRLEQIRADVFHALHELDDRAPRRDRQRDQSGTRGQRLSRGICSGPVGQKDGQVVWTIAHCRAGNRYDYSVLIIWCVLIPSCFKQGAAPLVWAASSPTTHKNGGKIVHGLNVGNTVNQFYIRRLTSNLIRSEIWRQNSKIRSDWRTFGNTARTLPTLEVCYYISYI